MPNFLEQFCCVLQRFKLFWKYGFMDLNALRIVEEVFVKFIVDQLKYRQAWKKHFEKYKMNEESKGKRRVIPRVEIWPNKNNLNIFLSGVFRSALFQAQFFSTNFPPIFHDDLIQKRQFTVRKE